MEQKGNKRGTKNRRKTMGEKEKIRSKRREKNRMK